MDRWEAGVHHWGAGCWGPDTRGTDSGYTASYTPTDTFPTEHTQAQSVSY